MIYVTWAKQSSCTLSKEKQNVHILIQIAKQREWKILKNDAAETYLEPCQLSIMECLHIADVWYGCKYTPEVVPDSKICLK